MLRDPESTVGKMIDRAGVSFLSSVDGEGFPNTKAMLNIRLREGIRRLYFSTNTSSLRVEQFRQNPKACVYVFDKRFYRGVMLRGTVEVRQDAWIKNMLWQEGDTLFYPGGVEDPDYCVLQFTAIDGRYYSNLNSVNFTVKEENQDA